jgi:hypothetical protein
MSYREKARDEIAAFVNADRPIPRVHSDFREPKWALRCWRDEYDKAMAMTTGERVKWASRRQVRAYPEIQTPAKKSLGQKDYEFYRKVWREKEDDFGQIPCEECGQPLSYASSHVSHNLSRGAHPELRWDKDNVSILCLMHHRQWEDSHKRKQMLIWPKKRKVLKELLERSAAKLKS